MVPHTWGSRRVLRRGAAVTGITGIVVTWWLLITGIVTMTMPAPPVLAATVGPGLVPGQAARVFLPGMSWLPIPVERAAFETQRGYRESDAAATEHAFTAYEWVRVSHDDAVRVVTVDGEAIQVESLEGVNIGHRGWLKPRHLGR